MTNYTWSVTGYPKDCTDTKFVEIDIKFAKIQLKITVCNSLRRTITREIDFLYYMIDVSKLVLVCRVNCGML